MMEYLWAIFVVTALTNGSGDQKYTRIDCLGTYDNRVTCEESLNQFVQAYTFADNETAWCLKVDQ